MTHCIVFAENGSAQSTAARLAGKSGSSSLGYNAPDLTSGVQANDYNFTFSDKNSNCSSQKGINGMSTPIPMAPFSEFRPISEHFYEQPMVPIMQKNSPDSHERAPFLPDQRSSCSSSGTYVFFFIFFEIRQI